MRKYALLAVLLLSASSVFAADTLSCDPAVPGSCAVSPSALIGLAGPVSHVGLPGCDPEDPTCVATVPEPETLLLFAIGGVSMLAAARRKK